MHCEGCGAWIRPSDPIEWDDEDRRVGRCCKPFRGPLSAEQSVLEDVMPRGATVASACRTCFQIPAANGVCGCP